MPDTVIVDEAAGIQPAAAKKSNAPVGGVTIDQMAAQHIGAGIGKGHLCVRLQRCAGVDALRGPGGGWLPPRWGVTA